MKKKEFREHFRDRLEADGIRPKKDRLRRAMNRVNAMVRIQEGEVVWLRRYIKNAIEFYRKNK